MRDAIRFGMLVRKIGVLQRLLRGIRMAVHERRCAGAGATVGLLIVVALSATACSPSPFNSGRAAAAGVPSARSTAVDNYNNAETLRFTGHCDGAIPAYLRAVTQNPMFVNAYVGLGFCYQNIGSYNAAIVEFDKAIAIDPTNYGLYIDRAGAEAYNGSAGAAISDDFTALRFAPVQVPTYVSIANSFSSFQDFADAIKAYDKAIALVPTNPSLYEQRAGIYLQMQDSMHAFADYQRAIKVAPFVASRGSIYSDLASVYDQQGDYPSAYGAIATAIRLQPGSAHFYIQSGNIHQSANDSMAALALYDKALGLVHRGPDALAAHESKGDVLITLGRNKDAIAEYNQALKLATDTYTRIRLRNKIKTARSGPS